MAPDSPEEGATGVPPPPPWGKEVHLSAPAAQLPDPESSPAPAFQCPKAGGKLGGGASGGRWGWAAWGLGGPHLQAPRAQPQQAPESLTTHLQPDPHRCCSSSL